MTYLTLLVSSKIIIIFNSIGIELKIGPNNLQKTDQKIYWHIEHTNHNL